MKDVYILGIESSCDETSCSIVKNGRVDIATTTSSQIDIHENFGGVVPEIASREHVKNITLVGTGNPYRLNSKSHNQSRNLFLSLSSFIFPA